MTGARTPAMTVPCLGEPAPAGDLDAAIDELRARGLRLSASRRLVLEGLFAAGRPATAEEIASGMYGRLPRCDLASVYRNLETLEQLGLVRHMHLGHGPGLYAPAADDDEYVACERCGRSEAVSRDVLHHVREAVREAVGYEPRFGHFPLTGLCPSCKEKLDVRPR
jgi:Fur family transcriptional regulator, ferric uptake regulator